MPQCWLTASQSRQSCRTWPSQRVFDNQFGKSSRSLRGAIKCYALWWFVRCCREQAKWDWSKVRVQKYDVDNSEEFPACQTPNSRFLPHKCGLAIGATRCWNAGRISFNKVKTCISFKQLGCTNNEIWEEIKNGGSYAQYSWLITYKIVDDWLCKTTKLWKQKCTEAFKNEYKPLVVHE